MSTLTYNTAVPKARRNISELSNQVYTLDVHQCVRYPIDNDNEDDKGALIFCFMYIFAKICLYFHHCLQGTNVNKS